MAARQASNACIFCMPDPCTCFEKPKKPVNSVGKRQISESAPPSKTATLVKQDVITRSDLSSVTRSAADAKEREDREFRDALTVLCVSGLVGSEDIEKHRAELNMSKDEIDILIWKQRRLEWQYVLE